MITAIGAAWPGGFHAAAEATVRAARPLVGADAAAVVEWTDGRETIVAASGDIGDAWSSRPAEGASWSGTRPVGAVSIEPRTDLVVTRSAPIAFSESELEALEALAQLMRGFGSGRWRDAIARGSTARVVASLDLGEVLIGTADTVAQLLRAEMAGVLLPDGDGLRMRTLIGNKHPDSAHLYIGRGQGLAGRVLVSGRAQRLDDYPTDPRSAPELMAQSDLEGTCAAMAVPLRWQGNVGGVLAAWRRSRTAFTDEDQSLFEALGEMCGGAIQNATRYQAQVERADRFEAENDNLRQRIKAADRDVGIHAQLTVIASEGSDVESVLHTVACLTHSQAILLTDDDRILGACEDAPRLAVEVRDALRSQGADGTAFAVDRPGARGLVISRVRAAGVTFGHLALALDDPPTSTELLAAEHAAVVSALLLAREDAAVTAAGRLESEFVWDLLEGRLPDSVEASVRARHLGKDFTLPALVVAVAVTGLAYEAPSGGWNPEHLERTRAACARHISKALAASGGTGAALARRADLFAAILPLPGDRPDDDRPDEVLAGLLAKIQWPAGMTAEIGISALVGSIGRLPAGWREAQLARSASIRGRPGIFRQLGVLQFLLAPTSRADLEAFARSQLGALLDYDANRGTELTRTLEMHLSAGCSTRRTAEIMCIHHRTASYRLQRIADLTGLCLDDQEHRFRAELACKILALDRGPLRASTAERPPTAHA